MGTAQVKKDGTVLLRGVSFPIENVRAAMVETGGIPVSDPAINTALDGAMAAHMATSEEKPEALTIDAVEDHWFIPVRINLHLSGSPGVPSERWIYFAVRKKKVFNA